MRVLFIGNVNSFLIINLAIKLKESYPEIVIDILSDSKARTAEASAAFTNILGVNSDSRWSTAKYIKVLWYANQYRKLLRKIKNDYDMVHIFYLSSIYSLVWNQIKCKAKKIIVSVFGSEFYRSNAVIKRMQKKMVKDAQILTATNEQTLEEFSMFFNVPKNKQRLCRFGLSVLDELEKVTEKEIQEFKLKQQINPNTLIIACGYNAQKNQNLETIIEQISSIKNKLPDITLFFQLPSSAHKEYTDSIIEHVKKTGISFRVFSKTFSNKELAVYRKSCDFFIQVQNTDTLSGAMQEFLCAGAIVITGAWLPYEIFDNLKIDYIKINYKNEIGESLLKNIDRKIKKEHNKAAINTLSNWKFTIQTWRSLY